MAHTSAPDGGPASPVTPAPGPALLLILTLLAPMAAVQAQQGPITGQGGGEFRNVVSDQRHSNLTPFNSAASFR